MTATFTPKFALGMMSGTSVDGAIDVAILETDGDTFVERKLVTEYRYEATDGPRAIHHCTKAAELAYRAAKGDAAMAAKEYGAALERYVAETFKESNPKKIAERVLELSLQFLGVPGRALTLADIIDRSTTLHCEAAEKALAEFGAIANKVELVGYHGQTLFHAPASHLTVQVGDAQMLADRLGRKVVFDFRRADINSGGQGAPLAPIYHRALLKKSKIESAAVLNLGGTANLTLVSADSDELLGFDTGPANGLIDRYVKEKSGLALDADSKLASSGKVSGVALKVLVERAIQLGDGRNYLEIAPPKSLDIRDYTYDFKEFLALSLADGCATLNAFSAECVAISCAKLQNEGRKIPESWILCGGGARSPHLRSEIQTRVGARIGKGVQLISADQAGWSAQGMEAELFAFLAVRAERRLPITFPGTTGVSKALAGGEIFTPRAR